MIFITDTLVFVNPYLSMILAITLKLRRNTENSKKYGRITYQKSPNIVMLTE